MILKRILAAVSAVILSVSAIQCGALTASAKTEGTPVRTPQELMNMKSDGDYYLACDIDMFEVRWKPVADFSGHFDGNGYAINDLYSETYGLFSTLKSGAVVENVTMSGVYITSKYKNIGAVAAVIKSGEENIKIDNCFVSGVVASCRTKYKTKSNGGTAGSIVGVNNSKTTVISNCYSNAVVASERTVGGIVGTNRGTVKSCGFGGEIVNSANVYELATYGDGMNDLWSYLYASGGIAGFNYGRITDCFSSGVINDETYYGGIAGVLQKGGSIKRCVNSADVLYGDGAGGLIAGYAAKKSTVSDCYSKKPTDNTVQNDIGKGKTGTKTYAVSPEKYTVMSSFKRLGGGWVIDGGEPIPESLRKFMSSKYLPVYIVRSGRLTAAYGDDSDEPDDPVEPDDEASVDHGYDEYGNILE